MIPQTMIRHIAILLFSVAFSVSAIAVSLVAADDPEINPPKFGEIISVIDGDPIKVQVNLGESDGVKVDQFIDLYRDGEFVGWVTVSELTAKTSTGKVNLSPTAKATKGMKAVSDTTLQLALEINRIDGGVASAVKLAQLHAEADLKVGLTRILGYGEPIKESKDEETGLDVRFAAGCLVSEPLTKFVNRYNQVIRDDCKKKLASKENDFEFAKPIMGKISNVVAPDASATESGKTCEISLGSLDGLKPNDHLSIYRGKLEVSYLQIQSVEEQKSIGKIVSAYAYEPGDIGLLDTTVDMAHRLVKGEVSQVKALELAKLHAEADSKLGFNRLLTYGKAPGGNGLRIDEESGLPMMMAGGCIVSEQMQSFIKEYNRLMKDAATKKE